MKETIDSILAQTFEDFELIISDNASTDKTEDICREYMSQEPRIRYYRNKENLGASWNHNRTFELSNSKYFKWMSYDDIIAPEFLEKCIQILEMDRSVICSYTLTKAINEKGEIIKTFPPKPKFSSKKPYERFFESICIGHPQVPVFGVIHSDIMRKTRLLGNYSSSDRTIVAELALRGKLYEINEYLFFKRYHPMDSSSAFPSRHLRQAWFDPKRAGKITFPHWRLIVEHFISVTRVPLSFHNRILCYGILLWWIRRNYIYLAYNLIQKERKRKPKKYAC